MSSEEPKYAKFLDDNHIEYIPQYEVYCPFTRNKLHKVDFFLPKQNLYVEVEGFMTLYAINTLRFYLEHSPLNFMLLQMTEEDWMGKYNKTVHVSMEKKRVLNYNQQFKESITLPASQLNQISIDRLNEYIALRNKDLETWLITEKQDQGFKSVL